ncbi:MAG: hypothetical protein ACT4PN_06510 [Nitrospiraceae bacterium]
MTPNTQTDGRHRARAAQMDRAKTPTQSGLVTRIGGEERPTGGGGGVLACVS